MAKGRGGQLVRPGVVIREELSRESPLSISELYRRYRRRFLDTYTAIGRESRPGTYHSFQKLLWMAQRLQLLEFVDEVPPVGTARYYDEQGQPHGRPIDDALRQRLQASGDFHNQRRFRLSGQASSSGLWLDLTAAFKGLFLEAPTIEVLPKPLPALPPPPKAPTITTAKERPTPKPRPVIPPTLSYEDIQDMLAHYQQLGIKDFQSILDGYLALIVEFEAKPTRPSLESLRSLDIAIFNAMIERIERAPARMRLLLEQMINNMMEAGEAYDDLVSALARGDRKGFSAALQILKKCCVKVVET
ncbi:MAG: hypothetical protein Q7K03_02260 [Dehalococcoidia bacterium]|nr:hypothetical protein [Dehalococcoidia bacterium]